MQSRTLAVALALITAFFVAFAWWVYFASEGKLHWAIPALCTAIPIAIALFLFVLQRLLSDRAAAGLERALSADARQQRRATAGRAELDRLRAEFERAVQALKGSKLARGQGSARDALYRLPWYTIIGPPACGKTTVLVNSGLKFPHLSGTGQRLKGVGGTRNCDWFLSNHGILLDTAGRWTTEDDDRDEWLSFLDLLKRHRSNQPLNGVIAAISLAGDDQTSIAGVDLDGVRDLAGRMRERLDEITGHLGLSLPVYLMFTKCDLVKGFVETFGELNIAERKQVWGFTAPLLSDAPSHAGAYFADQFGALCESLERYAVRRMGADDAHTELSPIFDFPAQMRSLETKLSAFVDELFSASAFAETPIFRGVYFTSGTQEGAPADLLLEQMSQSLDVRQPPREHQLDKKSYFLHDPLMKVVFEDRHLATATQTELMRQQRRRRIWTSSLFAAAGLVVALPTVSCRENLSSLARTREVVSKAKADAPMGAYETVPAHVPELRALDAEARRLEQGMPSLLLGFGLYQGNDLKEPLLKYDSVALKEWLIRPLLNRSNERLITITQQFEALRQRGAKQTSLDDAARRELQEALKLHLLLTNAPEACVPEPTTEKDWILQKLESLWNAGSPNPDKGEQAERRALLARYLELLRSSEKELSLERDKLHVGLARNALGSEDRVAQLLNGVQDRFQSEGRDLARLAGASSALQSAQSIAGAYTLEAWTQISQDVISPKTWTSSSESWLLGCQESSAEELRAAQHSDAFQKEYFARYEEQWRRFLSGLATRSPNSAADAENVLNELVARPGVLGNLFRQVKDNTELPPPRRDASPVDKLVTAVTEGVQKDPRLSNLTQGSTAGLNNASLANPALDHLRRTFAPLVAFGVPAKEGMDAPLELCRKQLDTVLAALQAYKNDKSQLEALRTATQTAFTNIETLLNQNASEWTSGLRELLLPPLRGLLAIGHQGEAERLQQLWCDQVYLPYRDELGGRFPLQAADGASAKNTASLQSFANFFRPGTGTLWKFQSAVLGAYVSQEGERFRVNSSRSDARGLIRDDLLTFLNQAHAVTRAFFPGGGAEVRVPFRVRVRGAAGYSVTSLSIGNRPPLKYASGAEVWVPVEWPGEEPSRGATLAVTPYEGRGPRPLVVEGDWGLFQLLGYAEIVDTERSERQFTARWRPNDSQHPVKIDFQADDPRSPILRVPFRAGPNSLLPLRVPSRIAPAGPDC